MSGYWSRGISFGVLSLSEVIPSLSLCFELKSVGVEHISGTRNKLITLFIKVEPVYASNFGMHIGYV